MAFTKGTANFTNGSKVVTGVALTSGQLAFFASGTAVFVQSEGQLIEAIGLPKDGNGSVIPNQFLLRGNWMEPTGSYDFVAFDTIEGLLDAVQSARGFSEQLQAFVESAEVNPVANSFVKRTSDGRVKAANAEEPDDAIALGQTGTAYSKNVTTNPTDTTAGRLLKVGDGGLLGKHNKQDYSIDLTYNGFSNNSSINPVQTPGGKYMSALHLVGVGVDYPIIAVSTRLANGTQASSNLHFRKNASEAWRDVYHNYNILGTVSQSGGGPTGAIIERGSNTNGEYVKFADGTLICWHTLSMGDITGTATLNYSNDVHWIFPAAFNGLPSVIPGTSDTSGDLTWGVIGVGNFLNTSIYLRAVRAAARTNVKLMVTAKGRWF